MIDSVRFCQTQVFVRPELQGERTGALLTMTLPLRLYVGIGGSVPRHEIEP